ADHVERVLVADGARIEARFEEVTLPPLARLDVLRVEPVERAEHFPKAAIVRGDDGEVDVVRHQAPGDDADAAEAGARGRVVELAPLVARAEEDPLARVAALRHVMKETGNDDSSGSCHVRLDERRERRFHARSRTPRGHWELSPGHPGGHPEGHWE